mmetsp:Transcript_43598/g.100488  ORF Transcript_43598/g.100488 Transcript_43598/m.100488 type:complete len:834 (-) Transcript_43598:101-2602(-)
MALAPQRAFVNPALGSYTPCATSQKQSPYAGAQAMLAAPASGANTPSCPGGPLAVVPLSSMPSFTGNVVSRLSSSPSRPPLTPPVPPSFSQLSPRGRTPVLMPGGMTAPQGHASPVRTLAASPVSKPAIGMPLVRMVSAARQGGGDALGASPPRTAVQPDSQGSSVLLQRGTSEATTPRQPYTPRLQHEMLPAPASCASSRYCGDGFCGLTSPYRATEEEQLLQSTESTAVPASGDSYHASVDRRVSAPQASASNSAVGSRSSLDGNSSPNPRVERFITRIGLSLGFKHVELAEIAMVIDRAGFETIDSLQNLSDNIADELEVDLRLAEVLREESIGRPPWMKLGPLPSFPRSRWTSSRQCLDDSTMFEAAESRSDDEHDEDILWSAGGLHRSSGSPGPRGMHLHEASTPREYSTWSQLSGGLPLRDVGTRSPWRRAQSPAEERAFKVHRERHNEGRTKRCFDLHEMRVSNKRRDKTPDPWVNTSSFKRSSAAIIPTAGNSRSMAFAQWPERARDVCGDIAPTITDDQGGWRAAQPQSPRRGGTSPSRSTQCSSPVANSPRRRKSPPPQPPLREAPTSAARGETKQRQATTRQRTPNKTGTGGLGSRANGAALVGEKMSRAKEQSGDYLGWSLGDNHNDCESALGSTTTAGSLSMYPSVQGSTSNPGSCVLKPNQPSQGHRGASSFPGTPPVPPAPSRPCDYFAGNDVPSLAAAGAGLSSSRDATEIRCSQHGCAFLAVGELNGNWLCKGCLIHHALELTVGSRMGQGGQSGAMDDGFSEGRGSDKRSSACEVGGWADHSQDFEVDDEDLDNEVLDVVNRQVSCKASTFEGKA